MTKIQRGAVIRTTNAFDGLRSGTLTATVAPVALSSDNVPVMEIIVQNDPDSGEAAFVGDSRSQNYQLNAGVSVTIPVCDLSLVYVRSAAGAAIVNWLAPE
jgi:hypothetical protein